jgi:16S rRNA (cytidine1402-2'-O)-methyltransferase
LPLTFAPTPIGNLDDLSFRALDRLTKGEIFFCEDTRVTKKLLTLLAKRHKVVFYPNPQLIALHSHNEKEVIEKLDRALFDRACVYVSDAGTPCLSDPGALLVDYAIKNKIEYEVLPGANAAITAFAASGLLQDRFIFYGFLPHKAEARRAELKRALGFPFAIVLYESPHRILDFAALIGSIAPKRRVCAFKEMTKLYEKRFFGLADELESAVCAMNPKGEWTIIIAADEAPKNDQNDWLIDELQNLNAPIKPLSKILAKLTDKKAGEWYEKLRRSR